MRTFSTNFRESLNGIRQIDGTVCYYSADGYTIILTENSDTILTENGEEISGEKGYITYNSSTINSINPAFKVNLFKTVCKSISIDANSKIDKEQYVCAKIGALVNSAYEYMNFGNFKIIDEPTYQADTKSYLMIGYDKMVESMVKYDSNPLSITYPISHKNLVIAICNHFNWEYNLSNYTNYDKIIDTDLYYGQDLTYRDILDDLCQVTGTNFMFDLNDNFIDKDIVETNTTIDDEYLKDTNINIKEKYGKVNALTITSEQTAVIGNREDTNSINLNGKTEFNINNNRLMLYNNDLFIDDLFNKINGLEFYTFDIDSTGLLIYEPLDRFTINHNGTNYSCALLGDNIKLSQGLVETIYTDKPTETKSEYTSNNVDPEKINNAIFSLNKAKAEIVLKADSNGHIVEAKLSANGDTGSQFNVLSDNISLEGYTTINNGFKIDLAGNMYSLKAILEDILIRGGDIKLNDNGSSTDSTIVVYNKNNTTKTAHTLSINDLMNGETLNFNWQNLFDTMANHPTYFVDDSGYPNLVDNELITFSNGSKIYLDIISANGGYSSQSILMYKVQYIDRLGNKTDLLYDRWSYNWSSSGSYHTTYTQLSSYSLSNDIGYVSHISDEAGNLGAYIAIFDSITYQKLLLTNYSLINSGGITIKDNDISTRYSGSGLNITDQYGTSYFNNSNGINWQTNTGSNYKEFIAGQNGLFYTNLAYAQEFYINMAEMIFKINGTEYLKVNTSGVTSTAFNNSSLESLKKNFTKLDSGLSIINNSDIIKYNYKSEEDCDKKHIGLVIPDLNGNFKTPNEIISKDGKGIDTYSMISIAWKAIQEQQQEINELKEEIKKLKESDK